MTTLSRLWLSLCLLLALATASFAQSWSRAYEEGLTAARAAKWLEAREAFRQAMAYRPEDASLPTLLPGPPTERRRWRDGAPYSPSFLAAYALYRDALTQPTDKHGDPLRIAGAELESLLDKGQPSREAFYFLDLIYERLGDGSKRTAIAERYAKEASRIKWRVDTEIVTPEEMAAITAMANPLGTTIVRAGDLAPTNSGTATPGRVAPIVTKFALVIGNAETSLTPLAVPHAASDARRMKDALVTNAGYPEENVTLILNGTGEQIQTAAQALAARIPNEATVLIYFAGAGANLAGADYLAGTTATSVTDSKGMVAKSELYRLFMAKGARIFAFFEAHRPIADGRYFGSEIPLAGSIAQVQGTLPGESVTSQVQNGQTTGTFTGAVVDVLSDLKSNRIPILEFGWQVFYKIRRGSTGTTGGGSRQTPTLPVLTNLASDARF
ncbi:MAG: caspase family protein [Fimbriimonas sp.]